MSIRLIVNADDLGLHPRIDEGILRAHREGIVTSASVLVTAPNAPEAIRAARAQGLALGVHLCLTSSLPPAASGVQSLAPRVAFRPAWPALVQGWTLGGLKLDEVAKELRAQVALARSLGAEPDHLDSHQHLHLLPGVSGVVQTLAETEGLPLRWPRERARLSWLTRPGPALKSVLLTTLAAASQRNSARKVPGIGLFEAGALTERRLCGLLASIGPGDHELGCHPGLEPGPIESEPGWSYGWTTELAALTGGRARDIIGARGIELTSYGKL